MICLFQSSRCGRGCQTILHVMLFRLESYYRGFAIVHKTLSFATGAAIAGLSYLYIRDQIRFSVGRVGSIVMPSLIIHTTISSRPIPELKHPEYDLIRAI